MRSTEGLVSAPLTEADHFANQVRATLTRLDPRARAEAIIRMNVILYECEFGQHLAAPTFPTYAALTSGSHQSISSQDGHHGGTSSSTGPILFSSNGGPFDAHYLSSGT